MDKKVNRARGLLLEVQKGPLTTPGVQIKDIQLHKQRSGPSETDLEARPGKGIAGSRTVFGPYCTPKFKELISEINNKLN